MTSNNKRSINILIGPLDWGLGHTTRCMPIINELLRQGANVILAGNAVQRKVLSVEFPNCTLLPLDGYNVGYAAKKNFLPLKIGLQLPSIKASIQKENKWLKNVVKKYNIAGVISDNRYGLYHSTIPSVFITHQLSIKTNLGKAIDRLIRKVNFKYIERFNECWIPDYEGDANLAGALSHPTRLPNCLCIYIGSLSRFSRSSPSHAQIDKNNILCVISGPEPQRSIFESLIFTQIKSSPHHFTVLRGLPNNTDEPKFDNATVYNHLDKHKLEILMKQAAFVICRSGYSSIMDLNALKATAILIPTPGQAEQEYLGKFLMQNGFAPCFLQKNFEITEAIAAASTFNYRGFLLPGSDALSCAVSKFIQNCRQ